MNDATLAIADPIDPDVFHTDVTCADLWLLAARVEAATGGAVDDPEALLDQAHADGLLVLDGLVGGLRRCLHCRSGASAGRLLLAA